jgi:hypothetical protein
MNSKRSQLLWTGVAASISLLLMIATTYSANIVIGGDYTDIGTIVVISPKPGDTPQNNGTALLNNLAGITGDVDNPYLIKLGPGIFDLGTTGLQMKEYVSIEGSGEMATKITSAVNSVSSATVMGADNAELRFLTVENTGVGVGNRIALLNSSVSPSLTHITVTSLGGTNSNYGVRNLDSSSPKMTNVTVTASGGTYSYGVYNDNASSPTMTKVTVTAAEGTYNRGVSNNEHSSPTMINSTVTASGGTYSYGVVNTTSSPTMTNVTVTASGGTNSNQGVRNNDVCTVKINHSIIKGTTNPIYNYSPGITRIANTQLDGGPAYNQAGGTLTCLGAYDDNYVALSTNCQ